MSLDKLSKSTQSSSDSAPQPRRKSFAWLLPCALIAGFIIILLLLFGDRLLPGVDVTTTPAITLRTNAGNPTNAADVEKPVVSAPPSSAMLFQASGWVEPDPYIISASVLINGFIDEVFVLEGQQVTKGELLATLIDDDEELDLRQSQQAVTAHQSRIDAHNAQFAILSAKRTAQQKRIAALETQLEQSQDTLTRLENLPKSATSEQQIIRARFDVKNNQALLGEAEAELPNLDAQKIKLELEREVMAAQLDELKTQRDRAQLALDRTKIHAPVNGIVLNLHAAPGKRRMLTGDDPHSSEIAEIYDPEKLQARIDVPLSEAAGIQIGQPVELTSDLLPDTVFQGTVTRISGEADIQRNTLQAKVAISNPDKRLRPEMLVRAKFYAPTRAANSGESSALSPTSNRLAIYAPQSAIVNDSILWIATPDNTAERRDVTLGTDIRDGYQHVTSGLRSGERIILPPHDELEPGTRINPTNSVSN